MFKRIAFFIAAIILLLMAAVFLFAEEIEISVPEEEAQSAINDFLTTEEHEYWGVRVSPKYISLDFKTNNSAEVTSDLVLDGLGYSGQFDGKFTTGINYRRPYLYLDQLSLLEGGFVTDDSTHSELADLKKVAIDVVRRQRNRNEVERSEAPSDNSDQGDAEVVEDFVLSATKTFFENIPVYDVASSGKSGLVASLALKDVRFTEHAAIVTLSPVTAILRILAMLGFACLVIAWFFGPAVVRLVLARSMAADDKK